MLIRGEIAGLRSLDKFLAKTINSGELALEKLESVVDSDTSD
jgi:hypothetical protein